jgi:tetratricopeptide (TPR) repeat protein
MPSQARLNPKSSVGYSGAPILGIGQILVVVVAAITLAFLLIPKETELVERLVEDGRHDRAQQLIVTPGERTEEGTEAGGTEIGKAEELIEALLAGNDDPIDAKGAQSITTLIKIADDPRAVHLLLEKDFARFAHEGLVACLDALAHRAIQADDSPFAVELYRQRWEIEAPDADHLVDVVAAHRYAGDPQGALDAISLFLHQNGQPFSRLPQELRMTTVALHREINQGSKAFDLLSKEYESSLDAETRQHLIDLMTVTAAQSERIADCLPVVEAHVSSLQPAKQTWQQLLTTTATDDRESFVKYGMILAQHREWSGDNQGAFDLYLKLAALGDIDALDRCVVIYPWIDAQDQATDLLTALAPVAERPHYTLLTARLEADRGHIARGIELIKPLVSRKPDPILWNEYAQMLDADGQLEDAIDAYQRAAELDPANSTAQKLSARLLIARGDFDAALATLLELPSAAHDKKSLEDFTMLASALGDEKAEERALLLRIDCNSDHPEAGDYEDLSDFYKNRNQLDTAINIARSGIEALPNDRNLVILLADRLTEAGRTTEAWQLLSRDETSEDPRFASRLLDLGSAIDPSLSQSILARIAESSTQWPPSQRLELAALHELSGQIETALQLYRITPSGAGDVARIEAEIAFAAGDVGRAVELQRRYLEAAEPDYEGWMFLGDLHQAAGDAIEARFSYERALEILRGSVDAVPILPDSTSVDSSQQKDPSEPAAQFATRVTLETLQARRRFEERF